MVIESSGAMRFHDFDTLEAARNYANTVGSVTNYALCPDTEVLNAPTDYGFALLRNYKPRPGAGMAVQNRIVELLAQYKTRWKARHLDSPRLWAYYIPYHNERPQQGAKPQDVIGYVDFPATDPCCPYVVTGQMKPERVWAWMYAGSTSSTTTG